MIKNALTPDSLSDRLCELLANNDDPITIRIGNEYYAIFDVEYEDGKIVLISSEIEECSDCSWQGVDDE